MPKHVHRLSEIDQVQKLAWCKGCNEMVRIGLHKKQSKPGVWRCLNAQKKWKSSRSSNYKYRNHVKDKCEFCGFIPIDMCQLDVDHIDGDHSNNDVSNLQTLCANCHRLKTKLQKDGMYNR